MSESLSKTADPSKSEGQNTSPIASVVGSHSKWNVPWMAIFLGFMAVIGYLVCRKEPTKAAGPNPDTAPSLPPALASSRTTLPLEALLSRTSLSGGESLWDIRRKSPMVIFNKTNGGNSGPIPSGSLAGSGAESGGFRGGGTQPFEGAPLPKGFSPETSGSTHARELGDRNFMIAQGKLIDAVLETSINSDHPGLLRALVSHDIYGDTGREVLLPRGSRLVGEYDSAVAKGQNRVFVLWQRAIRPDGIDIQLGSAGTDAIGGTGIEGRVNYHFWAMFGAATLLSVIGGAASTVGVNPMDQNNSLAQLRENVTNGFNSAGNTVLGQFAGIKPTITVRQGAKIKVFVARDLYFDADSLQANGAQWIP